MLITYTPLAVVLTQPRASMMAPTAVPAAFFSLVPSSELFQACRSALARACCETLPEPQT